MILAPSDMEGFQSETTIAQMQRLSESAPELTPRAWWRASDDRTVYRGAEETIEYIKDLMMKEQFDVSALMKWEHMVC